MFFRGHRPALGVAVIGVLEASTVVLAREVARADRKAAIALVPYLGWNAFALVLNTTIASRRATGRPRLIPVGGSPPHRILPARAFAP